MKQCSICGKRFTPTKSNQAVCSADCLIKLWEQQPRGKKSKANAKRIALTIGLRSMGEVKFAAHLEALGIEYEYEPDTFDWTPPKKRYTPDFRLKKRTGGYIYVEYKGNFKGTDRTKLLNVKRDHPDLDLRLVFERAGNKLNKVSKTTYADWCEKHGFPWAEKEIPKEWRKE